MSTEQLTEDNKESSEQDRLETINQQLAETEQVLKHTLEFFERIEGTEIASRLRVSDLRLRLLTDLEQIERERDDPNGK